MEKGAIGMDVLICFFAAAANVTKWVYKALTVYKVQKPHVFISLWVSTAAALQENVTIYVIYSELLLPTQQWCVAV